MDYKLELNEETTKTINDFRHSVNLQPLKASSLGQYVGNYNTMSANRELDGGEHYFHKPDDVFEWLKTTKSQRTKKLLNNNSRRNYLNMVIQFAPLCGVCPDMIQQYINHRDSLNEIYNVNNELSEYTEDEKEKIVTEAQIDSLLNKLRKVMNALEVWKGSKTLNELSNSEEEMLTYFILMTFYKTHRLRNDIASLRVMKLADYNKLKNKGTKEDPVIKEHNLLIYGQRELFMVLHDFKTNKNGEGLSINITDKKLKMYLGKFIRLIPESKDVHRPLIRYRKGEQMTAHQLTLFLQKNNMEHLGSPLSTRLLRKIFYSEKYGELIDEMKKDAKENLHSTGTAMNIYTKK